MHASKPSLTSAFPGVLDAFDVFVTPFCVTDAVEVHVVVPLARADTDSVWTALALPVCLPVWVMLQVSAELTPWKLQHRNGPTCVWVTTIGAMSR